MVLKNISLNAWSKNENLAPIVVAQGDVKSDIIEITLVDDNGQPINLTDITPRVHFAKPDKTIVYIDADIISAIGGKISVTLTSQCTAVPGMIYATVQLISDSEPTLYIKGLRLQVEPNSIEGSAESTNEFTALTEALSTVQQYDGRIGNLEADKANKTEVIPLSQKGVPGGVATLDSNGKLVQGLPDTGWVDVLLNPPFIPNGGYVENRLRVRRIGNQVNLIGLLSTSQNLDGLQHDAKIAAILPEIFRPPINIRSVSQRDGYRLFKPGVNATGEIIIGPNSESDALFQSGCWLPVSLTYFI